MTASEVFFVGLDADDWPCIWRNNDRPGWPPILVASSHDFPPLLWEHMTRGLLELIDRQRDSIDGLYGCECDLGQPCTVAACVMAQELEAADEYRIYRGARQAGLVAS